MRYSYYLLLLFLLTRCDSGSFDKDKRQIRAKNVLRSSLPTHSQGFDVLSFTEDTLASWKDSSFQHPLQYSIDYVYTDSTGTVQRRKGQVIFTPDGHSVISSQINPKP